MDSVHEVDSYPVVSHPVIVICTYWTATQELEFWKASTSIDLTSQVPSAESTRFVPLIVAVTKEVSLFITL